MRFQHVCLESVGYTLPAEVMTSDALEARLEPAYQRLRLPAGRLELMTGIRERRFWPAGTMPSEVSVLSVRQALAAAEIGADQIGALVHASVCRDYLEPATACLVHSQVGLPDQCLLYDTSNACLGFLNGIVQLASLIELGQIRAGVVVASEGSRDLVENTIDQLNENTSLTRDQAKLAFASLTIGSGSVAAVLVHQDFSKTGNLLQGGLFWSDTRGVSLCHSERDEAASMNTRPLMQTDSETLMHAGIGLGQRAFEPFLSEIGWTRDQLDRTVCHQVGLGHRKLMLQALGLDAARDFTTVETLGNTGSVALPITLAIGAETGFVQPGDRVALLGIGSGINTLMLAGTWQQSRVLGGIHTGRPAEVAVPS